MKRYIKSVVADPLHEDYEAKWELAQTSNNARLLDRLANSSGEQIVYQVLKNPNTAPETLKRFVDINPQSYAYDRDKAELAMENLNMPVEVLQNVSRYPHLLNSIAINPNTPRSTLEKLIQIGKANNDLDLLGIIAINPNVPEQYLLEVANGNSIPDKCRLAKNPNISHEIQEYLYSLDDHWIEQNLADNPGVSEDILQKILTYSRDSLTLHLAEMNLERRQR